MINDYKNWIRITELLWYRNQAKLCYQQLYNLENKRRQLIRYKEECNDIVYRLCNHKWERDLEVRSEHTEYICSNCGLSR